jgi:DNA polymerase
LTVDLSRTLFWDCETRSTVDLRKTGAYIYAVHPSTSVTVARLAIGKEPPVEWRPGMVLEDRFVNAMNDPRVEVVAHNAAFERLMLDAILHPRHGWPRVPIDRWVCTMARARAQALPGSLDGAANAAGLDVSKDQTGYALMLRMCRPRSLNADGSPVWWTDEERMSRLSEYCSMDVKVERALYQATAPLPVSELDIWDMTERMNDRGVRFDLSFVRAARVVAEDTRLLLDREITGLTNGFVNRASKVEDLKRWLRDRGVDMSPPPELLRDPGPGSKIDLNPRLREEILLDIDAGVEDDEEAEDAMPELRRRDVIRLIADKRVGALERKALKVRLEAGKISTRKLDAIMHRADDEGVVRGLLGYHGANTGRYISMGLQVQNFPRDVTSDWDGMRALLDQGARVVDAIGGPPLDVISRMLRGAIIARPGHEVATGDFSSVEAVGVAWLAGQTDLLHAFRAKRKIYEEMAGRVYNRRPADIASDSVERQVGKTLVLGAGYQMGWWKFRETCLVQAGVLLTPEEAEHAIKTYRETYPAIPALWSDMQNAAIAAVRAPGTVTAAAGGKIRFKQSTHWLRMRLPSGRFLWYNKPLLEQDDHKRDRVTYMAVNQKTRKWERQSTYGGRLVENAVSGLCRDLLTDATMRLEAANYNPVTLVHDEIIAEPERGHGSIGEMCELMSVVPPWASGFALSAKGARGPRYQKT